MDDSTQDWLLLAYSLPTEPSRYRVSVWRRLRKLGAVYLNEGFWVLPNSPELLKEVEGVIAEIRNFSGVASAFVSKDLETTQGGRLREKFFEARNEEYSELHGQVDKFVLHVDHARATHRFTFAEVEELEEEIAKLERWLNEIRQRDLFHSPAYDSEFAYLEQGRTLLQRFTEDTFANSATSQPPEPVPDGNEARLTE